LGVRRRIADGRAASGFTAFAREVRGFERTLLALVAGSFVTSGVLSFARSGAHDISTVTMITLVGTLAGCFAVISTYLAWPHRPDEENARLIGYDPSEIATSVRINFVLSLTCLILYAALPLNSWAALRYINNKV